MGTLKKNGRVLKKPFAHNNEGATKTRLASSTNDILRRSGGGRFKKGRALDTGYFRKTLVEDGDRR